MAASNGRKSSSSSRRTSKTTTQKKSSTSKRKVNAKQAAQDSALFHEIGLILLCAVMLFLFFCNFGLIGPFGNAVSGILFGLFGFTAYIAPILFFLAVAFWFANAGDSNAVRKLIAGVVLFLMLGVLCDLVVKSSAGLESYSIGQIYEDCRDGKNGGGALAGSLSYLLQHYLGSIGAVLVMIVCSVVSLILLTEKSLLSSVKRGGNRMRELTQADMERYREQTQLRRQAQEENAEKRREQTRIRRQAQEEERARKAEERRLRAEEKENEKILRMERKVSGVMLDTTLEKPEERQRRRDDIHEITWTGEVSDLSEEEQYEGEYVEEEASEWNPAVEEDRIPIRGIHQVVLNDTEPEEKQEACGEPVREYDRTYAMRELKVSEPIQEQPIRIHKEGVEEETREPEYRQSAYGQSDHGRQDHGFVSEQSLARTTVSEGGQGRKTLLETGKTNSEDNVTGENVAVENSAKENVPKQYFFPPLDLLQKGVAATGDSARELKETAMRLQQTLNTFGVKVTITDISQGPSVTRYELQPEQGVKVSKIVGLADDIKLNLAALDIRIEAPIPGKAAIGIEVPNKENMPVALRDLLESREFSEFPSNIAFAVGKDIAGKVVVSDIAKMPHMLIAGATGSGKSVCINTLIMSILYKAHPDDVKLIMVDPKVVELSIYNGIPHLMIPVVTDPKKASAALHWGVSEMEDRYRKFAEYNVRDLKGYNKKVEAMREKGVEDAPGKLPQIVIIVDELADLMMVCPGEVEESICRLAQLARACGIHLIIATQRPSVDVITGLIKANMPSRVAFSVSSGVDSRTILDMVGAEKLLGKGDMLFYPQGYAKPARIQGAFVSDQEVGDVVDFLKNQKLGNTYAEDIEKRIETIGSSGGGSKDSGNSGVDELFERAGRLIINEDKASIGMLQRALQIGFNRAARIMDQLCQYGVVGEDEGKKPRKILMSPEQFEQLMEEV